MARPCFGWNIGIKCSRSFLLARGHAVLRQSRRLPAFPIGMFLLFVRFYVRALFVVNAAFFGHAVLLFPFKIYHLPVGDQRAMRGPALNGSLPRGWAKYNIDRVLGLAVLITIVSQLD